MDESQDQQPVVPQTGEPVTPNRHVASLAIVGIVAAAFAGLLLAKVITGPASSPDSLNATSITSVRNDASGDYAEALGSGKPVYVLFHSLSWQSCLEISAVADTVVPQYEGKVLFVNAITDDPSAQQLASKFSFQYIPTSFFLAADGTVIDSYTGLLSEPEMRKRLDALVAK